MLVRLALILTLVLQPAMAVTALAPCRAADTTSCGCCGPVESACGCEAAPAPERPAEPDPKAPPGPNAERLIAGVLPTPAGTPMVMGGSRRPLAAIPKPRPDHPGVSAQALLCIWRT